MPNRRRPQGDGMIRKRSDGRWEGRIIIGHKNDGTPMYKSVFGKTQKATLEQLHKLLDLYHGVDLTEECRMTLGEWLDKWLDEYMLFTIKERTLEGYRKILVLDSTLYRRDTGKSSPQTFLISFTISAAKR